MQTNRRENSLKKVFMEFANANLQRPILKTIAMAVCALKGSERQEIIQGSKDA